MFQSIGQKSFKWATLWQVRYVHCSFSKSLQKILQVTWEQPSSKTGTPSTKWCWAMTESAYIYHSYTIKVILGAWERYNPHRHIIPHSKTSVNNKLLDITVALNSYEKFWFSNTISAAQVKKNKTYLGGLWYWHRKSNLSSGTGTRLSLGSIVQKGKFSAAAWLFVNTLKNVDFLQTTYKHS